MTFADDDADDPIPKKAAAEDDEFASRDKLLVEIWEEDNRHSEAFQRHVRKSRQLGLTFVAASLGAAIFLFTRTNTPASYAFAADIFGTEIIFHIAVFIVFAALVAVYAVKQLDLGVYHQMLRGAVAFNEDLEEQHIRRIVGLRMGLTQAISHFSRHSDAKISA